jgi:carboxypeptidase C (cathepsin A)
VLRSRTFFLAVLMCLGTMLASVAAQDEFKSKKGKKAPAETAEKPVAQPVKLDNLKEVLSETRHTITVGGRQLEYTATAGNLLLKDEGGKTKASIFFIAYTAGANPSTPRPITFTFNGGPGSSSVWLHLGAFGPKRVLVSDEGQPLPPPYRLVNNDDTLLDVTDLVFIDPVTTGYSRPAPGENPKQFHGVQEDIQTVGDFIRLYTVRFQRWGSPKFLAGESYGTTRAAGLAGYLQDRQGMNLNGIMLISSVLNFQTIRFDEGNDLPYVLFLPTYTATAWYHKRLPSDLQMDRQRTLKAAEAFALGEYSAALMKGNKLSAEERQQVVHKLARFTGLSEDYVQRSNLRVPIYRFTEELLRDQRRLVGRYDSRYKGVDTDPVSDRAGYDPSYAAVLGPYTATLNQYLRNELRYESDLPYEVLTSRVQPWDYGSARNRYLNVAPTLERALVQNRYLRVFQANGYYDLATPYFATEYTFNHLGPDGALANRVTMGYYDAGHMMYVHRPSHQKLKRDLAAFIQAALREAPFAEDLGRSR